MSRGVLMEYLRLSDEDGDLDDPIKAESNSISNQRDLLNMYIKGKSELSEYEVHECCDDGWSGKNFDRPGVMKMLRMAQRGEVQCIIVKDMSRFGRDYITVGKYITDIFPFLKVRFISVLDDFDSAREADIDRFDISFKNLINDFYCRDLSQKVSTAKRHRARKGNCVVPYAPFGYIKAPDDKHRLIIDPEPADIVRRIFRQASNGTTLTQIARELNHDGVPTPMRYKQAAGCSHGGWSKIGDDNHWTHSSVSAILRNEAYIGKSVYGKRRREEVGRNRTVKADAADWTVVEDAHESIISREMFVQAQKIFRTRCAGNSGKDAAPLPRRVRCGVCGHVMDRVRTREPYYICRTPSLTEGIRCPNDRMDEAALIRAASEELRLMLETAVELDRLVREQEQRNSDLIAKKLDKIAALKEAAALRRQEIMGLYEAFVLGEISAGDYLERKKACRASEEGANETIARLESELEAVATEGKNGKPLVSFYGQISENYRLLFGDLGEIAAGLLQKVSVFPDKRIELQWGYRDVTN